MTNSKKTVSEKILDVLNDAADVFKVKPSAANVHAIATHPETTKSEVVVACAECGVYGVVALLRIINRHKRTVTVDNYKCGTCHAASDVMDQHYHSVRKSQQP